MYRARAGSQGLDMCTIAPWPLNALMHINVCSHEWQNVTAISMYADKSGCWVVDQDLVSLIYSLMRSFLSCCNIFTDPWIQ